MGDVYETGREHWEKMQADAASKRTPAEEKAALKGGDGGGTYGPMDRAQVADMIALSEARVEARLTDMNAKLDRLIDRIGTLDEKVSETKADNQRTRSTVRTTAIALGGTLLTGMALMVAIANVSFGFGTRVAETARIEAAQVYNEMGTQRVLPAPRTQPEPTPKMLPPPKANR
jgi:hypothetical protein